MTANGLLGELAAWTGLSTAPPASTQSMAGSSAADALAPVESVVDRVKIGEILDVCDRVLDETGQRDHVFDWLQDGNRDTGPRRVVDAYYPRRGLVVLCRDRPDAHDALYGELVPAHGLGLFTINLGEFRGDSGRAFSRVIRDLGLACGALSPAAAEARSPSVRTGPAAGRAPIPTAAPPSPAPAPPSSSTPPVSATPPPVADPQKFAVSLPPLPASLQRYLTPAPPAPPSRRPLPPPPPAPVPTAMPAPPPPAPVSPPRPAAPPPAPAVSAALQRYLVAPPPAPPPPTPAPALPMAEPSLRTPLPFEHQVPASARVLDTLLVGPSRDVQRRRVGQRQAEAAARAARFVDGRGTRAARRDGVGQNPPPGRPSANPWSQQRNGASTPQVFGGVGSMPAPELSPPPRSAARSAAIERALAHGRTAPARPLRPQTTQRQTLRPQTLRPQTTRPQTTRPQTTRRQTARPQTLRPQRQPTNLASEDIIGLGLVVGALVVLELVFGVLLAFGGGPVVLGLGLVLDGAARALGTLATARSGQDWGSGWPWACGLIGSPAVAAFAFNGDGSLADLELAPLAAPVAVIAIVALVIGLAGLPVGI